MGRKDETIDDIAEEIRIEFADSDVAAFFNELADRIVAAHSRGVVQALDELMGKK